MITPIAHREFLCRNHFRPANESGVCDVPTPATLHSPLVLFLNTIVAEYRWYFPANFDSSFLSGRRDTFVGVYRAAFYAHIISGPLAVVLGAFLMFSGGKGSYRNAHRWAGRAQMLMVIAIVVPSGFVMAMQAYGGAIAAGGFLTLSLATAVCAAATVVQARARQFGSHQRWASRCFLLLCSPLLLRVIAGALIVMQLESVSYPAMGPAPWVSAYTPWRKEIPTFRCPSAVGERTGFGLTNYAFCIADVARQIHQPDCVRGVFACRKTTRLSDITDGQSNTIAMAEIGTPSGLTVIGQYATGQPSTVFDDPSLCNQTRDTSRPRFYMAEVSLGAPGRGGRWADGGAGFGIVNTVLPPNSSSCAIGGLDAVDGIYSAGSFHQGGAHVLMADGAVVFMTENIEAGDPCHPTLTSGQFAEAPVASPYGLWGGLGTAAGEENLEEELLR